MPTPSSIFGLHRRLAEARRDLERAAVAVRPDLLRVVEGVDHLAIKGDEIPLLAVSDRELWRLIRREAA